MEKKLTTARTIAVLLAILLVITAVIIYNDNKTIAALKAPAQMNITAQRDIIREDCTASDPASQAKCGDDLQSLSDLLAKFSKNMHTGALATTTP